MKSGLQCPMNNSPLPHPRAEPASIQDERVRQMANQTSTEIHRKLLLENVAYTFRQVVHLTLNLRVCPAACHSQQPGPGQGSHLQQESLHPSRKKPQGMSKHVWDVVPTGNLLPRGRRRKEGWVIRSGSSSFHF